MSEIELQDAIIRHSLQLLRATAGEQAAVDAILRDLERDLAQLLNSRTLSAQGKREITGLITEAREAIAAGYANAAQAVDTRQIAVIIAEKTAQAMETIIPASVTAPTAETLASLTTDVLIEGAPSSRWWAKQSDDLAFRFAAQVRQGVLNGETNEAIVARIAGRNGIMATARSHARALVHSSVQTAANDARLATFRRNSRLIKGVRQISTLDSRTSDVCIAYSDAAWDLYGNPIEGTTLAFNGGPPRHWNCRSILTSIPKTFREIGLDIDEFPVGERASSLGPIAGDTSFDAFLRRQPAGFADAVLGKGQAELWRAGKITLRDLVSGTGRPLTLDQLRALQE